MAAFSRGLRALSRAEYNRARCAPFSTTSTASSGHNRWSKIRHDKGAKDASKNLQRSNFSNEIALISRLYGSDPNFNPRLAAVLSNAKKAGVPKAAMDAAIARGQGRSSTGGVLENMTFEVVMPPSVAVIIDAATDNKNRTMMDVKLIIKTHGGAVSPTNYLFQKKGRIVFEKDERNLGVNEVMDDAIEAGAEDIELDDDGSTIVWTEPSKTTATATALQDRLGLKVRSSDIIWDANEDTKVNIESEQVAQKLSAFIEALQDNPNVQGIYANVAQGTLSDEAWEDLQGRLDA